MASSAVTNAIVESGSYKIGPLTSSWYAQIPIYPELRNVFTNPAHLRVVARALGRKLKGEGIELVAGAETGGIPLATAISLETGLPFVYVRKVSKTYGPGGAVFGNFTPGQKVALIDDAISFGKQKLIFIDRLREAGLKPTVIAVILDIVRLGKERKQLFGKQGLKLIALTNQLQMIRAYERAGVWPTEFAELLRDFENNPFAWQGNKEKWRQFEELKKTLPNI